MAIKLQDGSNVQFSDLLNGNAIDAYTGEMVILSQVGSTNTYTKTVSRPDGKKVKYFVDKPTDVMVTVSRRVEE
jgi:hypothetical protein